VGTDHDTDGDGKADLVKAFIQLPKSAAEGKYKTASIYDPMPYVTGTVNDVSEVWQMPFETEPFGSLRGGSDIIQWKSGYAGTQADHSGTYKGNS